MLYLLFVPLFLAFIAIIWLDTEAFYEYTTFFKIYKKFPLLAKYKKVKDSGSPQTFNEYIQLYHDSFLTRLITCEICLSSWLGLLGGFVSSIVYVIVFGRTDLFELSFLTLAFPYLTLFSYRMANKIN